MNDLVLENNHTGKLFFYLSDNENGENYITKELYLELYNKSVLMDKKWNYVYLYGKEVDDFHLIDKNQIFALHHSAIQELSRINDKKEERIQELEKENKEMKQQMELILSRLSALENK